MNVRDIRFTEIGCLVFGAGHTSRENQNGMEHNRFLQKLQKFAIEMKFIFSVSF